MRTEQNRTNQNRAEQNRIEKEENRAQHTIIQQNRTATATATNKNNQGREVNKKSEDFQHR